MKNDYNYAVIFRKIGKGEKLPLLKVDSVALVQYDNKGENFTFMSGELAGQSSNDVSILGGEPDSYFSANNTVTLKKIKMSSNKYVYVFSKLYVTNYAHFRKVSNKNAQIALTKKMSNICLLPSQTIGSYVTTEVANGLKLTNDKIKEMLTLEEKKEEKKRR